jgi:hypothetical protein
MDLFQILGSIIGGLEMDAEDIAQPVPGWRDEVHPLLSTVHIEGAIKIHLSVLRGTIRDRCIHICPFDNEVDQRL